MNFHFAFSRKSKKPRTSRTRCRRRPTFEVLEGRVVLTQPASLVTGTVFRDLDVNGAHASSEPGLSNRLVYVDGDNDLRLDPGEIRSTTDTNGVYTLEPGG